MDEFGRMQKPWNIWMVLLGMIPIMLQAQTVEELLRITRETFRQEKYTWAAELARMALIQDPENCEAVRIMIQAAAEGDFCRNDFIPLASLMHARHCSDAGSHEMLIRAQACNGKTKDASFLFERMLRRYPDHPGNAELELEILLRKGRPDDFLEALKKYLGTYPDYGKIRKCMRLLRQLEKIYDSNMDIVLNTIERQLVRHSAPTEGKLLLALWTHYRLGKNNLLMLYFRQFPAEFSGHGESYVPWLQFVLNAEDPAVRKQWEKLENVSPEDGLLYEWIEEKHYSGLKKKSGLNFPEAYRALNPFEPGLVQADLRLWEWATEEEWVLMRLEKARKNLENWSLQAFCTAAGVLIMHDSIWSAESMEKMRIALAEILQKRLVRLLKEKENVTEEKQMMVYMYRFFAKSGLNGDSRFEKMLSSEPADREKTGEMLYASLLENLKSGRMYGAYWAASREETAEKTEDAKKLMQTLGMLCEMQRREGYLPGISEVGFLQNSRQHWQDSLLISASDGLFEAFGFPSLSKK